MDKKFIYGIAGLMCLIAIFPLPYGYYTFLRIIVTLAAVIVSLELKKENNFLWVLFGFIALLFNPIFPIYLSREMWMPIDLIVAGAFGWKVIRDEDNL